VPSTTEKAVSTIRSRNGNSLGQCERRGERHDAAHAGPRDHETTADGGPEHRSWRVEAASSIPQSDDGVERHVPGDADDDHGEENRGGDKEVSAAEFRLDSVQDRADLQADEDERQDVQREHCGLPDGVRRDSYPRGSALGRCSCHGDRITHHREDAGEPYPISEDPDAERADELQDDGRRHVLDALGHSHEEPSQRWSHDRASSYCKQERWCDFTDGEAAGGGRAHRKPVNEQRSGIVQQAFAFENRQKAVRRLEPAQHRRRRRGVRWGDDGAEGDRCWP
jgi:hypothetical protein